MNRTPDFSEQLALLATHLGRRRGEILKAWRDAVANDRRLSTASSLPISQFYDHIPDVLDVFEQALQSPVSSAGTVSMHVPDEDAAAHGLQRWQQGYDLREVIREWGHLQVCLVNELEAYDEAHPELDPRVLHIARRALAELCGNGVTSSAVQYFRLQQLEAGGHVEDLRHALTEVRELEQRRGELWREAAHDLRGNLSVVANVAAGLTSPTVPRETRESFLALLQKSVASLQTMLEDVLDLARLQAGHEKRMVRPFDAAVVLRELCDNLLPFAEQRGLYLKMEGAASLPVEGDDVKTRRIAQNLVLNALQYTEHGGVTVSWGDSRKNDPERWMLCVQDTGPGFHAGPGAEIAGALEAATEEGRGPHERGRGSDARPSSNDHPDHRPVHQEVGEGIGLSIVKRMCELLEAAMEMESVPRRGTTVRVVLPRRYAVSDGVRGDSTTSASSGHAARPSK